MVTLILAPSKYAITRSEKLDLYWGTFSGPIGHVLFISKRCSRSKRVITSIFICWTYQSKNLKNLSKNIINLTYPKVSMKSLPRFAKIFDIFLLSYKAKTKAVFCNKNIYSGLSRRITLIILRKTRNVYME